MALSLDIVLCDLVKIDLCGTTWHSIPEDTSYSLLWEPEVSQWNLWLHSSAKYDNEHGWTHKVFLAYVRMKNTWKAIGAISIITN
jgi:hypothetical protein